MSTLKALISIYTLMITKITVPANLIEYPEDAPAQLSKPKFITINEFQEYTGSRFTEAFNQMLQEPQTIIPICLDSPGGVVSSLFGILDTLAVSHKPILTFTSTMAASCAAVLLSAGTKGYRYASPNSMILIHQASGAVDGKASDIINDAMYMEKLNDKLMEILAKNSNKSKQFYTNLIKKSNNSDLFISPESALEYGLIDAIGVPHVEMKIVPEYIVTNLTPNPVKRNKKKKKV